MPALATKSTPEALRNLPTSARRNVNAEDVVVPDGYTVEALLVGLSVPTGIEFADDGTLFIAEGGATWPTRPGMSTRIFQLDGTGRLEVFANENLGGPRTMACHEGYLYVSIKGPSRSTALSGRRASRWTPPSTRTPTTSPAWTSS